MNTLNEHNDTALPPWEGRAILLVDLDAFFASVEQLDHPAWRGKPVIVGGYANAHGVVSTCSYEARAYGVRSAMASSLARSLCPDAYWTTGNFHRYREMSAAIMAILHDETPFVQQVSIDEAFLDVTPTPLSPEHPVLVARRIQARVKELGVTCSIGVATTKSVAKIASDRDKPQGLTVVFPGSEAAFLHDLPVRDLSGVGASAEAILKKFGIHTLGEMGRADAALLKRIFGKNGEMMRRRALGCEVSAVHDDDEVKSVSNEVTFATDLTEQVDVEAALASIAAKVGRRLRRKGLKGTTLAVKVRFHDRSTRSAQQKLTQPSDDDIAFLPTALQLLYEVWQPGLKIRLLGLGMSNFSDEAPCVQESLFDELGGLDNMDDTNSPSSTTSPSSKERSPLIQEEEKREKLLAATDALREKFGEESLRFGFELRNLNNTTGSSSKNVEDYK
jgi:DNA polymerase-4